MFSDFSQQQALPKLQKAREEIELINKVAAVDGKISGRWKTPIRFEHQHLPNLEVVCLKKRVEG